MSLPNRVRNVSQKLPGRRLPHVLRRVVGKVTPDVPGATFPKEWIGVKQDLWGWRPPPGLPHRRDNALSQERRIEIVEAKVAELVGLSASVARRTRDDDPEDPVSYVVMHDPEATSSASAESCRRLSPPQAGARTFAWSELAAIIGRSASFHDAMSGRCRSSDRRSRSVIPPHTPHSIRLSSASARHSDRTGQPTHNRRARF